MWRGPACSRHARMPTVDTCSGANAAQAVKQLAMKLTSGDTNPIRGMRLADGRSVYSVYDAMWNTGAYTSYGAVKTAWARLLKSEFGFEVLRSESVYIQFAGMGQRKTPCVDVRCLIKIVSRLNQTRQRAYWQEAQLVLERYLDGDTSMCFEVEENKQIGPDEARGRFALRVQARAETMVADDDDGAGYVYGMVSDAFPGHVKIGHTNDLERRLREANSFCALKPFRYITTRATPTPRISEGRAHAHFADLRRAGEFFEVDAAVVCDFFANPI